MYCHFVISTKIQRLIFTQTNFLDSLWHQNLRVLCHTCTHMQVRFIKYFKISVITRGESKNTKQSNEALIYSLEYKVSYSQGAEYFSFWSCWCLTNVHEMCFGSPILSWSPTERTSPPTSSLTGGDSEQSTGKRHPLGWICNRWTHLKVPRSRVRCAGICSFNDLCLAMSCYFKNYAFENCWVLSNIICFLTYRPTTFLIRGSNLV